MVVETMFPSKDEEGRSVIWYEYKLANGATEIFSPNCDLGLGAGITYHRLALLGVANGGALPRRDTHLFQTALQQQQQQEEEQQQPELHQEQEPRTSTRTLLCAIFFITITILVLPFGLNGTASLESIRAIVPFSHATSALEVFGSRADVSGQAPLENDGSFSFDKTHGLGATTEMTQAIPKTAQDGLDSIADGAGKQQKDIYKSFIFPMTGNCHTAPPSTADFFVEDTGTRSGLPVDGSGSDSSTATTVLAESGPKEDFFGWSASFGDVLVAVLFGLLFTLVTFLLWNHRVQMGRMGRLQQTINILEEEKGIWQEYALIQEEDIGNKDRLIEFDRVEMGRMQKTISRLGGFAVRN